MRITEIKSLGNGWFRIQGQGPCNWTQPPCWPATAKEIREHAFPEASEEFLREVEREARRAARAAQKAKELR